MIKHPVARFHIHRLASGRLLLIKHGKTIDTHEGRSQLTAWLSDDDAHIWQGGLMLDERPGVSYPDGFQTPTVPSTSLTTAIAQPTARFNGTL